jgi:hypothetical protein
MYAPLAAAYQLEYPKDSVQLIRYHSLSHPSFDLLVFECHEVQFRFSLKIWSMVLGPGVSVMG